MGGGYANKFVLLFFFLLIRSRRVLQMDVQRAQEREPGKGAGDARRGEEIGRGQEEEQPRLQAVDARLRPEDHTGPADADAPGVGAVFHVRVRQHGVPDGRRREQGRQQVLRVDRVSIEYFFYY